MKPVMHVCDVCDLLDNDKTLKMCIYCESCKAWICPEDRMRVDRRARAMVLRGLK